MARNGDSYKGQWNNFQAQGWGIFDTRKGAYFRGEWVKDKQNGFGVEKWPRGSIFFGGYIDGNKNDISSNLLIVINDYLRKINNTINEVENVFNKICILFSINDSLTELRLETLFQLNSDCNQSSLFNFFSKVKYSEYVLDFIFNLASVM